MILVLHMIIYIITGLVIYILIPPSTKIRAIREIEEDTDREQEFIEYALFYTIIFLWPIIGLMIIFSLISKTMIKYFGRKKE